MIIRGLKLRVALAALLLTAGLTNLGAVVCASSISSGDSPFNGPSSATPAIESSAALELSNEGLSLTGGSNSESALQLIADVALINTQPQLSLVLSESAGPAALPKATAAAPTFLSDAAFPLNLSDVPEPTTWGLLLLGFAGLFVARRFARKSC
jgi:hypothetical protein